MTDEERIRKDVNQLLLDWYNNGGKLADLLVPYIMAERNK